MPDEAVRNARTPVPEDARRPRTNAELRDEAIARMLQTAIRLIAERGATRLSLVDVGREAGYSHSLPNYYFGSKAGLLRQVYAHIIGGARPRIRDWARRHHPERIRPGLGNIRATVLAYLGLIGDDPTGARAMHVLWSESISSMPELVDAVQPWNRLFVEFFDQQLRVGIARGEVTPELDVESVAILLAAVLRGAVAQMLADPQQVDIERLATAAARLIERGVAPTRQQEATGPADPPDPSPGP